MEEIVIIIYVYDPQSLNHYAFERNNPYKYEDENGHNPIAAISVIVYVIAETSLDLTSLYVSVNDFNNDKSIAALEFRDDGSIKCSVL